MRYVVSRYKMYQQEMAYRFFVTDELYYINNNVVGMTGGSRLQTRFYEILHPPKEETRTSDEIINGLKDKLRKLK